MKKQKRVMPHPTCNKCGKDAPVNTEMSNEDWKVYDVKEPCSCGGVFKINFK